MSTSQLTASPQLPELLSGVAGVALACCALAWLFCCILAPYYIYKTYLEAKKSRLLLERLVALGRRP